MPNQKGYVSYKGSNNFKGKTLWSFRLKDVERWWNCGETEPKVNKGDLVEFDYEERNGGFSVVLDTIRHSTVGNGAERSPPVPRGGGRGDPKEQYWEERANRDTALDAYKKENDTRIQYQSARNAAIEWIGILVGIPGAVKVPEKNAKAVIDGLLSDYTNKFFDATTNFGQVVKTEHTEVPFESVQQ